MKRLVLALVALSALSMWQRADAAIEKFLAAHVPASKPPSSAGR
jgi:hypothetical protein